MTRNRMHALAATMLICILFATADGGDAGHRDPAGEFVYSPLGPASGPGASDEYAGTIRVYVTEINSRWTDALGRPFNNAFLAFALKEEILLEGTDTLTWTVEWHGDEYYDSDGMPFDDIQEDNVGVIVAVFNADGYPGYSDPPSGYEFTVHEVDACAAAACGTTGYNLATDSFSHTILVEDVTSSW